MSAVTSVAYSLLSSAAVVALPAAGVAAGDASPAVSPEQRAAVYLLGGLTFLIIFLANLGKALPVMRGLLSLPPDARATPPRPDHPLPKDHASMPVTHGELEQRLRRIESKIDDNAETSREEIKDLTKTMEACFRDLTREVAKLDGRASAAPAKAR